MYDPADFFEPTRGGAPGSPLPALAEAFAPRLAEMASEPGLVAAVDQHAADVREALDAQAPGLVTRRLDADDLVDYVLGFTDYLRDIGWREPVGYDFATLRLTAVCWLVREEGILAH